MHLIQCIWWNGDLRPWSSSWSSLWSMIIMITTSSITKWWRVYHEQGDLTGPLPSVVVATHQDKAITGRFVFFLVMMILNVILSSMIIVMIIYHNWWICSGGTPQTSRSSQQAPTRPQLYGHFPQSNHDHHPIMIMIIIIKTLFTLIVVVSQYFGNLCQKLSIRDRYSSEKYFNSNLIANIVSTIANHFMHMYLTH